MKFPIKLWVSVFALTFSSVSCQQESKSNSQNPAPIELQSFLSGTWEAVSIHVDIPSVDSTDYDSIFTVSEEYWVDKFRIQPVRTFFQPDNKYRQEFRNSMDSILNEVKGIWNVFGDTLILIEPNSTNTYLVNINKGLATFNSVVDWDGDGAEDDTYKAVHRKVSSSY